jgi:flagellar motor switch protein FliN
MPELQQLADSMLAAAGAVLGRLVEQPSAAGAASRHDHAGSIRTDGEDLVTLAMIPSLGAQVVVRFPTADMQQIVGVMLGGGDDSSEMGPMQLSIASETASQIANAMVEELAKGVGTSADGITASLCNDATLLPPPPFESFEGLVQLGELPTRLFIDFAAITLSKLGIGLEPAKAADPKPAAPERPAKPAKPAAPPPSAQDVSYTPMQPTPVRTAQPGQANLDLVHDVPLQISAVLGKTVMPLREVVSLASGSVFELDKLAAEPIDLYVNNILIARGEVVVVDDKYAVKISELNPQAG